MTISRRHFFVGTGAVAAVGLGLALAGCSRKPSAHVSARLLPDGTVEIDGVRYASADDLRGKFQQARDETGRRRIDVGLSGAFEAEAYRRALGLLKDAGAARIGFIVKPEPPAPRPWAVKRSG